MIGYIGEPHIAALIGDDAARQVQYGGGSRPAVNREAWFAGAGDG